MTDEEQLVEVKKAIGIADDFQDGTIMVYLQEVKEYLASAGVSKSVLESNKIIGLLVRGVMDLWNYGAGSTKLSSYFVERVIQLSYAAEEIKTKSGLTTSNGKIFYTKDLKIFAPAET